MPRGAVCPRSSDRWIWSLLVPSRVIVNGMTYCDLYDMDREFCDHGLAERRRNVAAAVDELLISPSDMGPFRGRPHKGNDPDYSHLAKLNAPLSGSA